MADKDKDVEKKVKDALKKEADKAEKEIKPGGIDKIQEKIDERDKKGKGRG